MSKFPRYTSNKVKWYEIYVIYTNIKLDLLQSTGLSKFCKITTGTHKYSVIININNITLFKLKICTTS